MANLKYKIKFDDVSSFLPPGYKPPADESTAETTTAAESSPSHADTSSSTASPETKTSPSSLLSKAKPVDVSAFLPPGFKLTETSTTAASSVLGKIQFKETNELIPADYATTTEAAPTKNASKVVFPSRPGGNKKPTASTPKNAGGTSSGGGKPALLPHQIPVIRKSWPTR